MRARTIVAIAVVAMVAWAALAVAGWPARPYRDNDFASLWVMGRMLLDGGDQYDYATYVAAHRAIGSRALTIVLPDTASFYPLTTALLCVPFATLPIPLAAPLWLVSQILVAAGALIAFVRRLAADTARRDAFLVLGLAIACQPAWILVNGGNMGGFILAMAAASATFLLSGRPVLAGVFAGLLLAVKPHPLFIAMVLLLLAVPRAVAMRMLVSAAAVTGSLLALSLALRPGWIGEFLSQMARVSSYAVRVRQSTLFGLLGPDLTWLAWLVLAASVAGFVLFLRTRPTLPLAIGTAVCVSLFVVPYGFSYDHILLLIPVAIAIALVAHAPEPTRLGVLLALAAAFTLLPWLLYALAYRRYDESLNSLVPLAVLAVLLLSSRLRATGGPIRVARDATG